MSFHSKKGIATRYAPKMVNSSYYSTVKVLDLDPVRRDLRQAGIRVHRRVKNLTGLKGSTFIQAGYVYAPYIPVLTTPVIDEG